MIMKKFGFVFMIALIVACVCSLENCKKSAKEINAEHEANRSVIKKKLTHSYCYNITKIALGQKFSRIDTIVITKYDARPEQVGKWEDAKYRAYVRTDGKVKGKIHDQEGTFTYWFETYLNADELDSQFFSVDAMFAEDEEGNHVIFKHGITDYSVAELNKANSERKTRNEIAKQKELNIDGIKIRFVSKDDSDGYTVLNYRTDKRLTDSQIKKVCKKIKEDYFYVMFSAKGDENYAYYLRDDGIIKHRNPNNKHLYY